MEEITKVPEKLTQKKLQKIRDGVLKEFTDWIENANKLFKSWELEYDEYDRTYLKTCYWWCIDIFWEDFGDLEYDIKILKKELAKHKNNIWAFIDSSSYNWDDWEYATYSLEVKRYEIHTIEELKSFMKSQVMGKIAEILNADVRYRNNSNEWVRSVDCKLLELFDEWAIDYETLLKLTYSDCKL